MSSSYRRHARRWLAPAIAAGVAMPVGVALAAQTYIQPQVDLRVESNDNFDLQPDPGSGSDVFGYIADLQALMEIATQRSETSVRPRVRFQEYPDRDDLERIEAFLDLRSRYEWERSELLVLGKYSRQDTYNADQPSGSFDPLDPNDPANPASSTVLYGETRSRFDLRPTFSHDLTERMKLGVEAEYEVVRYDSDSVNDRNDYDYGLVNGFASWQVNPVSDVTVGAYASTYEATDDSTTTDAYGGEIGYTYRWSDVTGIEAVVSYEQDDITDNVPVRSTESTSGWGGMITAYRKGEVSRWRFTAGRTFIPTGDSSKAESDQFRVQYDRDLSERLSFKGAARYEARSELGTGEGPNDRDFARADLALEWFMTPTWYLRGGYSYIWQDRKSDPGDAANNKLFASVGYRGLRRQRR